MEMNMGLVQKSTEAFEISMNWKDVMSKRKPIIPQVPLPINKALNYLGTIIRSVLV